MHSPLLFADRPDDVVRLREALADADFSPGGVATALGPHGMGFLAGDETGPLLRRTRDASPLATLIRLFILGVSVPRAAAERALPSLAIEDLVGAGVLVADDADLTARITLQPIDVDGESMIVPSDSNRLGELARDFVLGVGPAALTMAGLTIRQPVDRCLDLGAGSGVQALHLQRHADEVVATDLNARAVAFAEFAMRLNGITKVTAREGDLFAPVAGERFGLIVANPPLVISPEARFTYRDSGLTGDEICRRIVTEAPAHLDDGGWCQVLANWAHRRNADWQERLASWIEDLDCDAWIVQSSVQDAETYASTWIRHDNHGGDNAVMFDEWMGYYDRLGLEAVGFGLITLRRTNRARKWRCIEELAQPFVLPCGDAIAAAFDRGVWLAEHGHDDRALLDATLVVSPDMELTQSHFAAEGAWFLERSTLQLAHGLHYAVTVDGLGADLVAGCDGVTRVGELVQRLADAIGVGVADVTEPSLALVRRLVQQGFVTPQ